MFLYLTKSVLVVSAAYYTVRKPEGVIMINKYAFLVVLVVVLSSCAVVETFPDIKFDYIDINSVDANSTSAAIGMYSTIEAGVLMRKTIGVQLLAVEGGIVKPWNGAVFKAGIRKITVRLLAPPHFTHGKVLEANFKPGSNYIVRTFTNTIKDSFVKFWIEDINTGEVIYGSIPDKAKVYAQTESYKSATSHYRSYLNNINEPSESNR